MDLSSNQIATVAKGAFEGLPNLQELYLIRNQIATVAAFEGLTNLQKLDLSFCMALTAVPELAGLTTLQVLNLDGCEDLTGMPDASALTQLEVGGLPSHLEGWEAGGREAFSAEGGWLL